MKVYIVTALLLIAPLCSNAADRISTGVNLHVINTNEGVSLRWTKGLGKNVQYHIYRKENNVSGIERIATTVSNNYQDKNVMQNTIYHYHIEYENAQNAKHTKTRKIMSFSNISYDKKVAAPTIVETRTKYIVSYDDLYTVVIKWDERRNKDFNIYKYRILYDVFRRKENQMDVEFLGSTESNTFKGTLSIDWEGVFYCAVMKRIIPYRSHEAVAISGFSWEHGVVGGKEARR
jgi:hypothetical protein